MKESHKIKELIAPDSNCRINGRPLPEADQ